MEYVKMNDTHSALGHRQFRKIKSFGIQARSGTEDYTRRFCIRQ